MATEANANSEKKSGWARKANPVTWLKGIFGFIVDSKNEMKRITWPDKSRIFRSTGIVLSTVLLLTAFIWFADSVFNMGLGYFLKILR